MAKKVYAVKVGRHPGIYDTWDECKVEIDGFSKAEFKGFSSRKDAEAYLNEATNSNKNKQKNQKSQKTPKDQKGQKKKDNPQKQKVKKGSAVAYVDGSYDNTSHRYAAGGIIKWIDANGNDKKYEFSEAYDEKNADLRNVAGEIMGARIAINFCIKNGLKNLVIYHDYTGIAMWANDEWQSKQTMTKEYKKFVKEARKKINISFVKVKAHSGNEYNNKADKLARDALGL